MRLVFTVYLLFVAVLANAFSVKDSVGVKEKNGRKYILHKIEPKETLFSLSRRYNVSIEAIVTSNPEVADNLPMEAIIQIPIPMVPKVGGTEKPRIIHTVQPSETLYSISRQYAVSFNDLIKWNNLPDNTIKIGQKLVIYQPVEQKTKMAEQQQEKDEFMVHQVEAGETLYSLSRQYSVSRKKLREWNQLEKEEIQIGQRLIVGLKEDKQGTEPENIDTPAEPEEKIVNKDSLAKEKPGQAVATSGDMLPPDPEVTKFDIEDNPYKKSNLSLKTSKDRKKLEKVTETGIATLIEGSEETRKYLALHKSLPVGTIMEVKNEMNNLSVFVKVIGKLPETGENREIDLKITREAYNRLGAIDKKFRVQMSYIPK